MRHVDRLLAALVVVQLGLIAFNICIGAWWGAGWCAANAAFCLYLCIHDARAEREHEKVMFGYGVEIRNIEDRIERYR